MVGDDHSQAPAFGQPRQPLAPLLSAGELNVNQLESTLRPKKTVITMSMGSLGRVSRVCGELTGSCLTFAAGGQAFFISGPVGKASSGGVFSSEAGLLIFSLPPRNMEFKMEF